MTTDAVRTRLYNKKLLNYLSARTQLLDYLVNEFRGLHADSYSIDGVLAASAVTVVPSVTANRVNIAAAVPCNGVSGTGRRFAFLAGDTRLQNVRIPPDAGVVYHVGLEQADVEDGIETNPRTGEFEYTQYKESLGRIGNPTSVTDNGDGTLTINVNGVCESGKDYSGRTVRVWLTSRADGGIGPLSASAAIAIQEIAVSYSAPNNTILVPNLMGQTSASVLTSNYKILLEGPTVKRQGAEDLRNTSGCLFLAAITSVAAASLIVTCDTTDQTVISKSLAELGAAITLQSQAAGVSYAGGGNWADTTANPATTVEDQLDKVISDLSGSGGTAKLGAPSVGTDLSAGTLASQISSLATGWGKLNRTNTWSTQQTFSGAVQASGLLSVLGGARVNFSSAPLQGILRLAGFQSSLANGNNNDFDIAGTFGLNDAERSCISIYLTGTGTPVLTGINGGVADRVILLTNNGSVSWVLAHETASTAVNRFHLIGGANITVPVDGSCLLLYDASGGSPLNRWRLFSKNF